MQIILPAYDSELSYIYSFLSQYAGEGVSIILSASYM